MAVARVTAPVERDEFETARVYAAAVLRTHPPRSRYPNGLSREQWREVTRGDRPEVSGLWRDRPER
jgi:hypothetical protein